MLYISLGPSCAVRYQIDQHRKRHSLPTQATQFFDWLITSNRAILTLLACVDISTLLRNSPDCIQKSGEKTVSDAKKTSRLCMTKIDHIESIHDVSVKCSPEEMDAFVEKYIRRYHRLIHSIRESTHIIFLRNMRLSDVYIREFFSRIDQISTHNTHSLVSLYSSDDDTDPVRKTQIGMHIVLHINKNSFRINTDEHWTDKCYDWEQLFSVIEKHLN